MVLSTLLSATTATPKTPNRQLSYKERLQIHTLHYLADLSPPTIVIKLGINHRTVNRCLASPVTPTKHVSRPSILTTPSRRRLIEHATTNAIQRRKPREQIAEELGFEFCA